MAFPPAHFLVGAGTAEVVRVFVPLPPWRARLVGGLVAVLPDLDIALGLLRRAGSLYHGTFTHSIAAAIIALLVGWAVAGPRWGVLSGVTYASHLVVDLLDNRGRTNVLLAWPFSQRQPFAIAKVFPLVNFEQGHGVVEAFLSLLRPDALHQIAEQTLVGAAFAAGLFLLARCLRWALPRGHAP